MIGSIVALALIVIGVSDGDTLTVKDGDTKTVLRLAEIDAPERTQPSSQVARRNLEALCRNAKAIEIDPVDTDRYGRTVAHVRCDGVHVNWRQIEDGLAWCFTRYLKQPAECLPREGCTRGEGGVVERTESAGAVGVQGRDAGSKVSRPLTRGSKAA